MPNQRSHGKMPRESVKTPGPNAVERARLAPDFSADQVRVGSTESTNTLKEANGTLPGDVQCNDMIAMPVDNKRVPGRSGPAGP